MEDDGWQESRLIFLFCVFVDTEFAANHLMLLSQLAGKLGNEARIARLNQCQSADEIIAAILSEDEELEAVESKEEIMDLDLDF